MRDVAGGGRVKLAFFIIGGIISGSCGVLLLAHGNWLGGIYQLVLTAGFPVLYEASKL